MTNEERTEIINSVVAEIKASSQDITEAEEVNTLDGLTSLPCSKDKTLVRVPISVLNADASTAIRKADEAFGMAEDVMGMVDEQGQTIGSLAAEFSKQLTTDKIADEAVTTDKLANDSITAEKLADNAIETSHIANKAVTSGKLADGVIKDNIWNNIAEFAGFTDKSAEQTSPLNKNFGGWFWSTTNKEFLAYNTIDKKFYHSFSFYGFNSKDGIYQGENHLYVDTSTNQIYRYDTTAGTLTPLTSGALSDSEINKSITENWS